MQKCENFGQVDSETILSDWTIWSAEHMYRVEVKESAIEVNSAVSELIENRGRILEFDSRGAAESLAECLSEKDSQVRIQGVAPQDQTDVEGYLIHFPQQFKQTPKPSDKDGLTFDLTANQYGEVGKALVFGTYGVSPAVRYYFFNELPPVDRRSHRLHRIGEPHFPDDFEAEVSWAPDCLIMVYERQTGRDVARYFCEIKTGQASFERDQRDDMQTVASEYNVLKIRVDIEELPSEYTLSISPVQSE